MKTVRILCDACNAIIDLTTDPCTLLYDANYWKKLIGAKCQNCEIKREDQDLVDRTCWKCGNPIGTIYYHVQKYDGKLIRAFKICTFCAKKTDLTKI